MSNLEKEGNNEPISTYCEWCYSPGKSRCGRCHIVYYCSREHQVQHWSIHKKLCKKSLPPEMTTSINYNLPSTSNISPPSYSDWSQANLLGIKNQSISSMIVPPPPYKNSDLNSEIMSQSNAPSFMNSEMFTNSIIPSDINSQIIPNSNVPNYENSQIITSCNVNMALNSEIIPHSNVPSTINSQIINSFSVPTNVNSQMISNHTVPNDVISEMILSSNVPHEMNSQLVLACDVQKVVDSQAIPSSSASDDDDFLSYFNSEFLSSDNNFWDLITSCDPQNISDYDKFLQPQPTVNEIENSKEGDYTYDDNHPVTNEEPEMQCASLNDICATIVHDLNMYGICVLDQFVGTKYGNLILEEVKDLYVTGVFQKGELVNASPYESKENIRCDVTTWVDGTEPNCRHIGNLIRKLDVVMTSCNKMQNNGQLSKYKLHRRTKAMIACYPGDGTYYKKHIDNPHKDGRCITCIYYLNQSWDTKVHGGLLRMFPTSHDSQVANIDPLFDRMLFFWSDKRNPHEVLPAYSTRFAITVWYFDADERDRALRTSREKAQKSRNQQLIS